MPRLLDELLITSLTAPIDKPIIDFAEELAGHFGRAPLGVLFYGSKSREKNKTLSEETKPEGILDFYLLFDELPGNAVIRRLGEALPPNVYYIRQRAKPFLHAKVAVMTMAEFNARCGIKSLDTTIWARFCQPVHLLWSKNPQSADEILNSLAKAVHTASLWAAALGKSCGTPVYYWENLFTRTYKVELRVENKSRSKSLLEGKEVYFTDLLLASWRELGLLHDDKRFDRDTQLSPSLAPAIRTRLLDKWEKIALAGKPLNLVRLAKALFTFKGGVRYITWKITKHKFGNAPGLPEEMQNPVKHWLAMGLKALRSK